MFSLKLEAAHVAQAITARVAALRAPLEDFASVLSGAVADDIYKTIAEHYDGEGARSGGWAALSPTYAARKALEYPGAPLLVRTGEQRGSLRPGGQGGFKRVSPKRLEIGTSLPRARYHRDGTGKMPARPPIAWNDSDVKRWRSLVQAYITTRMAEGKS